MSELLDLSKKIPSWISESFFQSISSSITKDGGRLHNFEISCASKAGDNFIGAIFRVLLTFENEKVALVMKTLSESRDKTVHEYLVDEFVGKLFQTEIKMYEEVLPRVKMLWRMAGYDEELSPSLIHQSINPTPFILLEDLSIKNFKVIAKPPEDIESSKLIAMRLAKFHAASFYMANQNSYDFSSFDNNIFKNPILTEVLFNMGLEAFIKVTELKEDLNKYTEKLKEFKENYLEKAREAYDPKNSDFKVLCHNDLHSKNLMFKIEEGKVEDFYLIDFQLCTFSSIAIDLCYLLYFAISTENRQKYREEFLKLFHNQFVKWLKDFNFHGKIPKFKNLTDELDKFGAWEVLIAICYTVYFYFDFSQLKPEELDMADGTRRGKIKMHQEEKYLEMVRKELPVFARKGFI